MHVVGATTLVHGTMLTHPPSPFGIHLLLVFSAQGSGLKYATEVGQSVSIRFLVIDADGRYTTASRTVTIVSPCPPERPVVCTAPTGGRVCSDIQCNLRDDLLLAAALPPAVTLYSPPGSHSNAAELEVDYGQRLGWSLLPCASEADGQAGRCGASATSEAEGDVSNRLQVRRLDYMAPVGHVSHIALVI